MKDLQVSARIPAKDGAPERIGSVTVKAPETAEEGIKMFGDQAMNSNATANWVVTLQSGIRGGLKRGETPQALQARLGSAKMGVAAAKAAQDPKAAWLAAYQAATPQERKKMKADLLRDAEALS